MDADMTTELYILLKVKGSYNHSLIEEWIFKGIKAPDVEESSDAIYKCRDKNYIEFRGEFNTDSSFQHRDLFLTPYGEKRLNQLKSEYMKDYRKKILVYIKIALEVTVAIIGILSFLARLKK